MKWNKILLWNDRCQKDFLKKTSSIILYEYMVDERALTHVYVCVRLSDLALFLGVRRVGRVWFQSTANETQNWGKADKTCRSQVVNGSGRNDQLTSIADDPALMRPVCLSAPTHPPSARYYMQKLLLFAQHVLQMGGPRGKSAPSRRWMTPLRVSSCPRRWQQP